MAEEIEVKYLLNNLPEEVFSGIKKEIKQGYLIDLLEVDLDDPIIPNEAKIYIKGLSNAGLLLSIPKKHGEEIKELANPVVRVRLSEEQDKKESFLTIKGKKVGLSAPEYEYSIDYNQGLELIKLSAYSLIKTRYVVPFNELKIEVDVFKNIELLLAEIEIPNENYKINKPEWLEKVIEKEVSEDHDYSNVNLAKNGLINIKKLKVKK